MKTAKKEELVELLRESRKILAQLETDALWICKSRGITEIDERELIERIDKAIGKE